MPEAEGFLATAECLVRALLADLKVREFHTIIHVRFHGESKLRFLRTALAHLGFIRKVYFNQLSLTAPVPQMHATVPLDAPTNFQRPSAGSVGRPASDRHTTPPPPPGL